MADHEETRFGPVEPTDGWRRLTEWLQELDAETGRERSQTQLGKMLGVSQPAVRGWALRLSRPSEGPLRDAVCRITGSSPADWETSDERTRRDELESVGAPAS